VKKFVIVKINGIVLALCYMLGIAIVVAATDADDDNKR